jgi:hypothetical protein
MVVRVSIFAGLLLFLIPGLAISQGATRKNGLAELLVGKWQPNDAVQAVLGNTPLTSNRWILTFRKDETALEKIPEETKNLTNVFLKKNKMEIRLTGWMTIARKTIESEHPFYLSELNGNPIIIYARHRQEVKFGDIEELGLSWAKGETPERDILFITPRPSDAFTAFQRVTNKKADQQ